MPKKAATVQAPESSLTLIVAEAELESLTPYSQSRPIAETPDAKTNESHDAFDKRIWRKRLHEENGKVVIPPMCFKMALDSAASLLKEKVKGQGRTTYAQHFMSGVLVMDPLRLDVAVEDVQGEDLFVDANGKRGSGTRVWRRYPVIPSWKGTVRYYVFSPMITEPVFRKHLEQSGQLVGIGRFRPEKRGYYGRFRVLRLTWNAQ